MIQCPDCRNMIPDDSAFCDQCGKELKWCPECRRPKRGTECPVCGSDLIPGKKYLAGGAPAAKPSRLVGNGWALSLQAGSFGRSGGMWPELSSCQYVSGRHGEISPAPDGWAVTDVGSTNGTFVNGQRIESQRPYPLKKGDRVRIATLDFTVE